MTQKAPGRNDRTGLSVLGLFPMSPDETSARDGLENIKWPDGNRHCPNCGSVKTSGLDGKRLDYDGLTDSA